MSVAQTHILKTSHGNSMLVDEENYRYRVCVEREDKISWRCMKKNCKGRIFTNPEKTKTLGTWHEDHNHPADALHIKRDRLVS